MEIPIHFVQEYFKKLIKNNQLFHAYLLWGYSKDDEKFACALSVAELLENQPFIDCLTLRPVAGTIGIDAVRDAIRFIWQKPMRSARKTIIITDAECMTVEAQNASLKMVEEPPASGLLICMVRDPALLLPTLVSRFQKIYIPAKNQKSKIKNQKSAEEFLTAPAAKRKEMIKQLVENSIEDSNAVKEFVVGLMAELDKNPVKNYYILKELIHRWTLMNQITVNKRLQLEAVNQWIKN